MLNIDFEDPKFKSALRILQYAFLSALVIGGTVILVLAGQGYDVDRNTGQVIQNGLVLVNTSPEGATVSINGNPESDNTPGRFALPAGEYDFTLNRQGYRQWSKKINVVGSGVEWLYYPLLIPESLKSNQVAAWRNLEFIGQSLNGQQFLIRQQTDKPIFSLVSIGERGIDGDTTITLDPKLFATSEEIGTFTFEGWASDNRHVLITHTFGTAVEYLLVDIQSPTLSRNISTDLKLPLNDARFIDGNFQQMFALVNGDLRRIDLSLNTISAPIVSNVNKYVLHKNRFVVFLNVNDKTTQVGLIENTSEPKIVSDLTLPPANYALEFAEFDNDFHLALLEKTTGVVTIYTNSHQNSDHELKLPTKLDLKAPAEHLSFSRNGQFVSAQSAGNFIVFDFDKEATYQFKLGFTMNSGYEAKWMDGFRLLAHDTKNMLHVFEFDGANIQELLVSSQKFDPIFNGNKTSMLTLSVLQNPTDNIFLSRTSLIIVN